MKKFIVFMLVVMMTMTSLVFARERFVTKVEVTDIDSPFEKTRVLDTSGKVPISSTYRISEVAWNRLASSQYEVIVTIIANVGFTFSGDIDATIDGNPVTSQEIVEDNELKISYVFTEKSGTSISSDTLKHRIIAYYDVNKGYINPNGYRVLNGYDQTFEIKAKEGYKVKEVIVDGLNLGAIEEYTFKRVTKAHEIRAYFEKIDNEGESNLVEETSQTKNNKVVLQFLLDLINMFKM